MATELQVSARKELRRLIEQIERILEEKAGLTADVTDKFEEAKSLGFDVKAMRKIIAMRKLSQAEREEEEAILTTYMQAVGFADTPLGNWAAAVPQIEAKTAA